MKYVDETVLREATQLLSEIDHSPTHPVHSQCVEAYERLEAWCLERQLMLSKINTVLGCAGKPDYFDNGGSYG